MVFCCLKRICKWGFILGIITYGIHWWIVTKDYIFSDEAVALIAKSYVDKKVDASLTGLHRDLVAQYPGHILPKQDLQWVFVNSGGWMGSMCLLHASLTEFVLIFGTAVDTSGHSGRLWANVSDTILTGSLRQWKEGELEVLTHLPGTTVKQVWGEASGLSFSANTWMLQYGRGFIPSTMGFALADTFFSTHDFTTLYYTIRIYIKACALGVSQYLIELRDYLETEM